MKHLITLILLLLSIPTNAADVPIAWDPSTSPQVAGYKVHVGSSSGQYSQVYDVGLTTTFTVPNVNLDTVNYCAVTAYAVDTTIPDSTYSNEITFGSVPVYACPCSIWEDTNTPTVQNDSDTASVELGVRFTSDTTGYINGLRFFKGQHNLGTHSGSAWSANGTLLGRSTFVNEAASGWQEVYFATAIPVTPNQPYTVSYHAPKGNYSADEWYFDQPTDMGQLHALADSNGGNGVYAYGTTPKFPTSSYNATNYWVDVIFDTTPITPFTVNFTGTPTSGKVPLTVAFKALPSAGVKRCKWNFGDATTSTACNVNHIYKTTGRKTVTLTVTSLKGQIAKKTKSKYITVQP